RTTLVGPDAVPRVIPGGNTDALGNVAVSIPMTDDMPEGPYNLSVSALGGREPEVLTTAITLRRQAKLMLSTDKPVYQPGQTIRMRSLTLRKPDLKPVADTKAVFTVTDPKGNAIFKHM